MDSNLLGGVKLHPLLGLSVDSTCFGHFDSCFLAALGMPVKLWTFCLVERCCRKRWGGAEEGGLN